MNKKLQILIGILAMWCMPLYAGNAYLQLSSAVDQAGGQFVAEIIDAQDGIDYDAATGVATIEKTGPYLVIFAPQTNEMEACGNYWLAVNNKHVANSNIRVCQGAGTTTVAVAQAIIELKKGDELTFRMSGKLGTQATKFEGEPLIPSAILSILKQ